jgi:nicotinamide mononucleotide transporter
MRFYVWEAIAVVFSLLYTLLIGNGSIWAWPFAISAGIIYTMLCVERNIYAEAFLHFFYIVMGVYGWISWNSHTDAGYQSTLSIKTHLLVVPLLFLVTYISGRFLAKQTDAKASYIDSFTTVFSIWATFLMVNVYLENWWYFVFINGVAVYLYFYRKMYITSLLMVVYVVLSLKGYWQWSTM